jgi:hypothetical protein
MRLLASRIVVCVAFVALAAGSGFGQTVSHLSNPGTERDVTDITGFMTTGEAMGGMRVTAHFTAALVGNETVNWNPGAIGSGAGSADGTGWRLDQSGDTWNSQWRLFGDGPNLTLYGLTLEGFLPSTQPVSERATIFDRTDPFFGTDGSYRGNDLDAIAKAGAWTHVRVVYSDEVDNLADGFVGAVGDVYRTMQIQFGNVADNIFFPAPFVFNNEFLYLQDTDTVGPRVPGDPGEEGAPEPSCIALVAIACVLAGGRRAQRKHPVI